MQSDEGFRSLGSESKVGFRAESDFLRSAA